MNIRTKLSALRKCGERSCKIVWDDFGNIIETIDMEDRNERLADKLQASIERDYQKWMVGWLERDQKVYEEMKKHEKD